MTIFDTIRATATEVHETVKSLRWAIDRIRHIEAYLTSPPPYSLALSTDGDIGETVCTGRAPVITLAVASNEHVEWSISGKGWSVSKIDVDGTIYSSPCGALSGNVKIGITRGAFVTPHTPTSRVAITIHLSHTE